MKKYLEKIVMGAVLAGSMYVPAIAEEPKLEAIPVESYIQSTSMSTKAYMAKGEELMKKAVKGEISKREYASELERLSKEYMAGYKAETKKFIEGCSKFTKGIEEKTEKILKYTGKLEKTLEKKEIELGESVKKVQSSYKGAEKLLEVYKAPLEKAGKYEHCKKKLEIIAKEVKKTKEHKRRRK